MPIFFCPRVSSVYLPERTNLQSSAEGQEGVVGWLTELRVRIRSEICKDPQGNFLISIKYSDSQDDLGHTRTRLLREI